jgi:hypothetical protein
MSWGSCYPRLQLEELFDDRKVLTEDDIAKLRISTGDRLWVFIRMMSRSNRRLFVCDCAEHYLRKHHGRVSVQDQKMIDATRKYALGKMTYKNLLSMKPWNFVNHYLTYCTDRFGSEAMYATNAVTYYSDGSRDWLWQIRRALKYLKGEIGRSK